MKENKKVRRVVVSLAFRNDIGSGIYKLKKL